MPFGGYHRVFRSPFEARAAMDPQSPLGCLLMIFVPVLLAISAYLAWWEVRFFVQGRTTEATVDGVQAFKLPRSRYLFGGSYLEVRYSFKDERTDRLRSEHDELPLSWPRPTAATVRIEYVPGVVGGSRLEGHRHVFSLIFFVACVIGSAVYGYFVLRDARRAVREEEAFESLRRRARES
jgi:hypothetical protein